MIDNETLSAEDKAYFDSRGETVTAPEPAQSGSPAATEEEIAEVAEAEADAGEVGEAAATGEGEKPTGQSKVPLAALTKTRGELKTERAARLEAERKAAILEDRWNQILAQREEQARTQVEEKPALDPLKDPIHAITELVSDHQQRKQQEAQRAQQVKEQEAANTAWARTLDVARAQYSEAASADATFEPTYTALRNNIAGEYMELYGLTQAQAIAEVDNFEAQQIAYAVNRGINVGEHMRRLAKARNVTAPAKQEATPSAEDLDKLAAGVNGATSLSNAGGGRVAATTAQSVADMSPEDFAAWLSKNGADKFRKLAGG